MSGEKDEKLLTCHPVWAWHPERNEHEAGYTLFRKTVSVSSPAHFHLALSADNRYSFYLDGKLLGRGPLRGDPCRDRTGRAFHHQAHRAADPGGLERTAEALRLPDAVIAGTAWRQEESCRLFAF